MFSIRPLVRFQITSGYSKSLSTKKFRFPISFDPVQTISIAKKRTSIAWTRRNARSGIPKHFMFLLQKVRKSGDIFLTCAEKMFWFFRTKVQMEHGLRTLCFNFYYFYNFKRKVVATYDLSLINSLFLMQRCQLAPLVSTDNAAAVLKL